MPKQRLTILDINLTVHRLAADAPIPGDVLDAAFAWTARTDEELSIVCDSRVKIAADRSECGWRCFKVAGPMDFSQVGVLAGISTALAGAGISIFAISTFDTDYILVRSPEIEKAVSALSENGYEIV